VSLNSIQVASAKSPLLAVEDLRWPFSCPTPRKSLLNWYRRHKRDLPWRSLWQKSGDPYVVWISEIMLQQTVIKAVIPVYHRFLNQFPDLSAFAAADEGQVREAVRGLGYYRRFGFMHKAARQLVDAGSAWPQTFAAWRALPGVGDYTAAAVSSIAFGVAEAVVDGNVERVFCRLLDLRLPPNEPRLKRAFKRLAQQLLDHDHPGDFNQAVMELGQTICTVGEPNCAACPLKRHCLAYERSSQSLAPAAKIKSGAPIDRRAQLVILLRDGKIGLVERPATARFLRGTAGFLTMIDHNEVAMQADGWPEDSSLQLWLQKNRQSMSTIGRFKHTITKHRIQVEVLVSDQHPKLHAIKWTPIAEVERSLLANFDRKAWQLLHTKRPHAKH